MPLEPGLVHAPLTPFADDWRIDFALFGRVIDFHFRHGAQAVAVPMLWANRSVLQMTSGATSSATPCNTEKRARRLSPM